MAEMQSRASTHGGTVEDDEDRKEIEAGRERLAAFLKKLTNGDLICLATHNDLFDAEGVQAIDHFIVYVRNSFIHQTVAVENGYWSAHFRPKLELDILKKMITADTEMNMLGLPSDMIVPEVIQRRMSKKHSFRAEPVKKIMLEPGTYLVTLEGIFQVMDRSVFASFGGDVKMVDSKITEHVLLPCPSAHIDSLFFAQPQPPSQLLPPPPQLNSNGHAHPSEESSTPEAERPPVPPQAAEEQSNAVLPVEVRDVKEEEPADDTFEREEQNAVAKEAAKVVLPPQPSEIVEKEPETVPLVIPPPLAASTPIKAKSPVIAAAPVAPSTSTPSTSNDVNGDKSDTESRKSREKSGSKSRKDWIDWVEEPKDNKRVSKPTRKRQLSEEKEKKKDKTETEKRSKSKSGSDSVKRSKSSRSKSSSQSVSSSDGSSSTPPPLLERQEPTAESAASTSKGAKTPIRVAAAPLPAVADTPLTVPPPVNQPIISIKPLPPRPQTIAPTTTRFMKAPQAEQQKRPEDQPSTSFASTSYTLPPPIARSTIHLNGHSSVIGMKPVPKELLASKSPKKDEKTEEERKEEKLSKKEKKEEKADKKKEKESAVKTRVQAPRVAVQKAQQEAKKRKRVYDSDYEGEEEEEEDIILHSEDEGDQGDERMKSDDEDLDCSMTSNPLDSSFLRAELPVAPQVETRVYTMVTNETNEEKKKQDEVYLKRIQDDATKAEESRRKLTEQRRAAEMQLVQRAVEKKKDKKKDGSKELEETDSEAELLHVGPSYSLRCDPTFFVQMRGLEEKKGLFLTRSLGPIYTLSRDFYRSLLKDEPCFEWFPKPRIGPDIDNFVYQVSGYAVHVLPAGRDGTSTELNDLHNHREFRFGEIVWAKFGKDFWPAIIQAFIPSSSLSENRGDAIRLQWVSDRESPEHAYVSYADCYHFDMYFAAMYMAAYTARDYQYHIALAICEDGRPGYWEEYITKLVYDEMLNMGGNVASIPAKHIERIQKDLKPKNPTPTEMATVIKTIHQKEIIHFERHYTANYKGRNSTRFTPKIKDGDHYLGIKTITKSDSKKNRKKKGKGAAESEEEEEEDDEEDAQPTKPVPRNIVPARKDSNASHEVNPMESTVPFFADAVTEVRVKNEETKETECYQLYEGASAAPIDGYIIEEPQRAANGIHDAMIFDGPTIARVNAYRRKMRKGEAAMNGVEEVADKTAMNTVDIGRVVLPLSEVTSFEVLHLMTVKQEVIDPATKVNDKKWIANTERCAEHIRIVFENKDKRIEKSNTQYEEQKRLEAERLAEIQREKDEKAAARSLRLLHSALATPTPIKSKKPRLSKDSENSEKKEEKKEERKEEEKEEEKSERPRGTPGRPKKRKDKKDKDIKE